MRIWFIGPGGTRHFIAKQPPGFGTGGFFVNGYYVDPGPGAVVRAIRMGISWEWIKKIVVTHFHLDHMGDLAALIEAVTKTESKVPLISTKSVYDYLDSYHKQFVYWINWRELSYAYETDHGTESFGIVFEDNKRLLYTSDTKYKEGMFPDVDAVIGNVVVFRDAQSGKHLSIESFAQLIEDVGAKKAFLHHYSPVLIHRLKEAKEYLEKNTSAEIIIAREGLLYDL